MPPCHAAALLMNKDRAARIEARSGLKRMVDVLMKRLELSKFVLEPAAMRNRKPTCFYRRYWRCNSELETNHWGFPLGIWSAIPGYL
jgi:hypothetical protein